MTIVEKKWLICCMWSLPSDLRSLISAITCVICFAGVDGNGISVNKKKQLDLFLKITK